MELILIRHGLPEMQVKQDGTAADPALSETGHDQAGRVARWLANSGIERLYSSPMLRALETAAPISSTLGLDVEVREGVAEFDRDHGAYIPVELLKTMDPERWKAMMQSSEVAVGDLQAFGREVVETLSAIVADNRGKRVAVTCHGGVINFWSAHVMGFPPRLFFNPNYTSINRFMVAGSGEKSVITLNEHAHLLA